jgi:hypothetical protein
MEIDSASEVPSTTAQSAIGPDHILASISGGVVERVDEKAPIKLGLLVLIGMGGN